MNLIDTSVIVEDLRADRYRGGAISVIILLEILRGIEEGKRAQVKSLLEEAFEVIHLSNPVVESYCRLYSLLLNRGKPIPEADLLIAATAISHNLNLVTKDEDFQRLEEFGLRLDLIRD